MSQFEFQTKEERDAWEVYPAIVGGIVELFDAAARRFDEREATCGIEPLTWQHFILGAVTGGGVSEGIGIDEIHPLSAVQELHINKGLLRIDCTTGRKLLVITDKGRAVLDRLNAMCKGEK